MVEQSNKRSRSNRLKRRMQQKAGQSPVLFLLLNKPAFGYTMLFCLLLLCGTGFYLAPLWNVAPDGYYRSVRTSLYRIQQNRQTKAAAAEAMQSGDHSEATYLLKVALQRNGLDPQTYRMSLTNAMQQDLLHPQIIRDLEAKAQRLLALTHTNVTDVDLVLAFQDHHHLEDASIAMMKHLTQPTPEHVVRLAKLLFDAERYEDYQMIRQKFPSIGSDALALLDQALLGMNANSYQEALGRVGNLSSEADSQSADAPKARALMLKVMRRFGKTQAYGTLFDRIRQNNEDIPLQHAQYWELLQQSGKTSLAQIEASQYWARLVNHRFHRLDPAIQMAGAFIHAGLTKRCFDLMDLIQPVYDNQPEYWMAYGNFLLEAEKWIEASHLAVSIRNDRKTSESLKPYSYFLEGVANARLNRRHRASKALVALFKGGPLEDLTLVKRMMREMLAAQMGESAIEFLKLHDNGMLEPLEYGRWLYASSKLALDAEHLAEANQQLLALDPQLPETLLRELETALLTRGKADALMDGLLSASDAPVGDAGQRLLVAYGLLLNGQLSQGEKLLEQLSPDSLSPGEQALFNFAKLECLVRTDRMKEAGQQYLLVRQEALFPVQVTRLQEIKVLLDAMEP